MRKIIENQPNRRICSYQRVNTTEKHDLLRPSLGIWFGNLTQDPGLDRLIH
ncbi:MAG: hypothetical protein ACKO1L_05790 [Brachymonas sp.]